MSAYQALRAIRTTSMSMADYSIIQDALMTTTEYKDIRECLTQFNEGLVTYSELINKILQVELTSGQEKELF